MKRFEVRYVCEGKIYRLRVQAASCRVAAIEAMMLIPTVGITTLAIREVAS